MSYSEINNIKNRQKFLVAKIANHDRIPLAKCESYQHKANWVMANAYTVIVMLPAQVIHAVLWLPLGFAFVISEKKLC